MKYVDELTMLARENRKKLTQGEVLVWDLLKNNKLGYKFLKQKPVGRFILDFYCSKLLLAVEIDGGYHSERQNYDKGRDELLITRGIVIIRVKEEDVLANIYKIKEILIIEISKRIKELK